MRAFVDDEIIPNVEDWEEAGEVPREAFKRAAEVGMLPAMCGWPTDVEGIPPRPEGFDGFFIVIAFDELCRCASGGVVWGLTGGFGIGLPPIVHSPTIDNALKQRVAGECIRGEKRIALAISEPTAGSDVGNLSTTAEEVGDFYVVNGLKKWITCGMFADYFTTAVRTGGEGMFVSSLFVLFCFVIALTVHMMWLYLYLFFSLPFLMFFLLVLFCFVIALTVQMMWLYLYLFFSLPFLMFFSSSFFFSSFLLFSLLSFSLSFCFVLLLLSRCK